MNYTLTPSIAYRRDYKSKAEFLKDWLDNKDFDVHNVYGQTTAINRPQAEKDNLRQFSVRYWKLRKQAILRWDGKTWTL